VLGALRGDGSIMIVTKERSRAEEWCGLGRGGRKYKVEAAKEEETGEKGTRGNEGWAILR